MNLGSLREQFRIQADDKRAPYFWSDEQIDRYINEAQVEAATRAWLLYEFDGPATTLVLIPGVRRYPLHPSLLRIDRAETDRRAFGIRSTPWADAHVEPDGRALVLRLLPQVSETLRLGAYRLPLSGLCKDTDEPEIHKKYHLKMLDWALHLAYREEDADTHDKARADRYAEDFAMSFGLPVDANAQRKQRERKRHTTRCNW